MPTRPIPFLKWAGGKRQLVPRILELLPTRIGTYYEPFLGGAAVFFALAAERRFERAVLCDTNRELVDCYRAVRDDVESVIAALQKPKYRNSETHYYRVRDTDTAKLPPADRAARLIFLNRCGFNGLHRVNSKGLFNVPFGRYRRPVICDADKLRAAAQALQKVKLVPGDFAKAIQKVEPRDFVYLDPPYVPVSPTASFTAYAAKNFGMADQERLALALRELGQRQIPALLSNSDCPTTRSLYAALPYEAVRVRRSINSDGRGRGPVGEILVRSFAYPVATVAPVISLSIERRTRTAAKDVKANGAVEI